MKKKQSLGLTELCSIILFSSYYIMPAVSAKFSSIVILAACAVYIALCCYWDGMRLKKETLKYILLVILISLLYLILTDTKTISVDVSNRDLKRFLSKASQLGLTFFPILFYTRCQKYSSHFQKKFFIGTAVLLFAYVIINTTGALIVNPNITRSWVGFSDSAVDNIGSYALVYSVPFLIVLCGIVFLGSHKAYVKLCMILLIILQLFFLLLAQYTLAVLITVYGLIYTVYCNTTKSRTKVIWLLAVVILIPLIPTILKFAADHVPSVQMSIRLYEIYYFILGGDTMGYNMGSRMELYAESIKAFLRSPIIGNRSLDFDGHATFLTVLSDLGLVGGIPYFYLYFHSYKKIKDMLTTNVENYKTFFIMMLMMGFTNPIHSAFSLMYVAWFIIPLAIQVREECFCGVQKT